MNPIIKPISVVLKEARQNKGISYEEAHKATRIHPNILRSLEEGTTLGLSHVYVKSYIKIYAKYLGINEQELNKYFHTAPPKEKPINLDIPIKAESIKIKSLPQLTFLTGLIFQAKRHKKIIFIVVASIMLLFLLIVLFNKPSEKDAVVLEKVTIEDKIPVPTAKPVQEEKPQAAKEAMPAKLEGDLVLTILAKDDTWMQITKDGAVVYKAILKKSASETWQAKESFDLWIANAGTVDIKLNGQTLAPLGKRGELLRSVVITKDGITKKPR